MRIAVSSYPTINVDEFQRSRGQGRDYTQEPFESAMQQQQHDPMLLEPGMPLQPAHESGERGVNNGYSGGSCLTQVSPADESRNPVLRVSQLAPTVTCKHLRALFGIFGPIAKIKVRRV